MGKLSGTVLILAGVSIAAYTLSAQQDAGGKASSASAPPAPRVAETVTPTTPPPRPATGALAILATQPADGPPSGTAPAPPKVQTPPAASPPPASFAPSLASPHKLRPGAPAAVRVAEAPPRLPVGQTAATASPPLDRPALTREIQRHLKRIGCYQGDVSGVWSPPVRQAVKTVTDRVNASLPIDQPDPVLLAMVQSQEPGACAASCPKGQDRTADGRCLPAAIIASAGKQRTPPAQAQVQKGRATKPPAATAAPPAAIAAEAPAPALDGRMSLAGPSAGSQPGANATPPRQGKTNPQRQRARVAPGTPRATAYYRPPSQQQRVRQRSAQRSGGVPFWAFPFFTP